MKFKIHHPKLLVVVLLLIIGLTSTAVLLACQGNSSSEPPVFPEMPINAQLTEPDKQEAVDIARNSGIEETSMAIRIGKLLRSTAIRSKGLKGSELSRSGRPR